MTDVKVKYRRCGGTGKSEDHRESIDPETRQMRKTVAEVDCSTCRGRGFEIREMYEE